MAKALMGMPSFSDGGQGENPAGNGQQQPNDGSNQNELMPNGQSQLIGLNNDDGDEDADPDMDELLAAFGDPNATDDDDDPEPETPPDPNAPTELQTQSQSLEAEIRTAISKMRIPDDAFPEDFDPTDRNQLSQVLNKTVQAAVGQSLGVVFKPVQLAIQHMATEMNASINTRIKEAREGITAQTLLEQSVPEINNPKYKHMVTSLDETLKSKGKKPAERAKTIRKLLNSMGIKNEGGSNRRSTGGSNNDAGGSLKQGKAALDSIFGGDFKPQK